MVEEQFAPVPVRTVPFFDKEMVGVERLAELGRALFGDSDPSQFLYRGRPYSVVARGQRIRSVGRAALHDEGRDQSFAQGG